MATNNISSWCRVARSVVNLQGVQKLLTPPPSVGVRFGGWLEDILSAPMVQEGCKHNSWKRMFFQ